MKDLIIIGAGGYGREVLQWCKDINSVEKKWNIKGFLDDNAGSLDGIECDISVIGCVKDYYPSKGEEFVVAVAEPIIKENIVHLFKERGASFASVIHPEAKIGSFNELGEGIVLYPGCRIMVNTKIGDFVTILDASTIGHDAVVGAYSTICGGCGINGHVELGSRVFVGSHASIVPGRKVGDDAYIGGGSVVVSNIKPGVRVFGNPAKKIMM